MTEVRRQIIEVGSRNAEVGKGKAQRAWRIAYGSKQRTDDGRQIVEMRIRNSEK